MSVLNGTPIIRNIIGGYNFANENYVDNAVEDITLTSFSYASTRCAFASQPVDMVWYTIFGASVPARHQYVFDSTEINFATNDATANITSVQFQVVDATGTVLSGFNSLQDDPEVFDPAVASCNPKVYAMGANYASTPENFYIQVRFGITAGKNIVFTDNNSGVKASFQPIANPLPTATPSLPVPFVV